VSLRCSCRCCTYPRLFLFSPIPGTHLRSFHCRCQLLGGRCVCVCEGGNGGGGGQVSVTKSVTLPLSLFSKGTVDCLNSGALYFLSTHVWFQYYYSLMLCKIHKASCFFSALKYAYVLFMSHVLCKMYQYLSINDLSKSLFNEHMFNYDAGADTFLRWIFFVS
jgi:hypothetical protein